jgi:transposase
MVYAEAREDMRADSWLLCHVHAFNYFGGVTRLLIPDNCKTATISNNRYEMILNRSYQELAEHYGTAIVPARVRKPRDKSHAEGSVRFAETWIIAALRNQKFFSLRELNEAVREKLEELNNRLHIPLHRYRQFTRMIPPIHTMIPAVHRWIPLSGRHPQPEAPPN